MRQLRYYCYAFILWGFSFSDAYAYGVSIAFGKPTYSHFDQGYYAYSSLFEQGRDNFHWLDFTYSNYNYVLPYERGQAHSLGTIYRFSHRLRWTRYLKPFLFTGVGALQVTKTERIKVGSDHSLLGHLNSVDDIHYLIFLGGGYLWQNKDMVIGFSLDYGYENGYEKNFWAPTFFLSFLL